MFNADFYPTPTEVIEKMLFGVDFENKIILEPSAGKGNIVNYLLSNGAKEVVACEKESELRKILQCKIISHDFLSLKSDEVSHINLIVANPPFSDVEKHLIQMWDVAPYGCEIVTLCPTPVIKNPFSKHRTQIARMISDNGRYQHLGECFSNSERSTDVEVSVIYLKKPGEANNEFEGFFMDDDEQELQANGLMPYNVVRDLVNRYCEAVKLFDRQLELGVQMNCLTSSFYSSTLAFSVTEENKPKTRNEFKKDLQKSAWRFVISKMNMEKYSTKGLKEDLNRFVETQEKVPFTMKNIYRMLEMIIGTNDSRMDKACLEVFDKLTRHYDENRYAVEGWKTNSHYLINQKFIIPWMTDKSWNGSLHLSYNGNSEIIEDLCKALCWLTGNDYNKIGSLNNLIHRTEKPKSEWEKEWSPSYVEYDWNTWYEWGFFEFKGFKKGTMHFRFKDEDVWAKFNQRIAKIKGFPLPEKL